MAFEVHRKPRSAHHTARDQSSIREYGSLRLTSNDLVPRL